MLTVLVSLAVDRGQTDEKFELEYKWDVLELFQMKQMIPASDRAAICDAGFTLEDWTSVDVGNKQSDNPIAYQNCFRVDGQVACGQVVRVADQWVPVLLTSVEAGLVFLAVLALLVVLLRVDEVLGVVRQLVGRVVR